MSSTKTQDLQKYLGTSEQKPRIQWNPSNSDRVERVMQALLEKFRTGELKDEIRPTTLLNLKGDFALFYHSAFPREHVPKWACKRFPQGWESFIEEMNSSLSTEGITILDSKRETPPYRRLSPDAREVIERFRQLVASGEKSVAEVVQLLRDDHKIELSRERQNYYFGAIKISPLEEPSLDERGRKLAHKIETLRSELGLDFSPTFFLKGLIFEGLVGSFFAHNHPGTRVERQVRLPITYKDFDGKPHHEVYLDFRIGSRIYETKLKNDYKNIIKSVLSQLAAVESSTGRAERLTVVYREPCPLFGVAYDQNLRLIDDANALGLQALNFASRRLQDVVEYVSAKDLFARNPQDGERFARALAILEEHWNSATVDELRYLMQSLDRIAASAENIPTKLVLLMNQLQEGRTSDTQLAQRLFGQPQEQTIDELTSHERRERLILKQLASYRTKMLCELYARLTNEPAPTKLSEHVVKTLEDCAEHHPQQFQALLLDHLASQEADMRARISGADADSKAEREVVRAYDLVRARQADQRYAHAMTVGARWETLAQQEGLDLAQLRKLYKGIYSGHRRKGEEANPVYVMTQAAKQLGLLSKNIARQFKSLPHRVTAARLGHAAQRSKFWASMTHALTPEVSLERLKPLAADILKACSVHLPERGEWLQACPQIQALDEALSRDPDAYRNPINAYAKLAIDAFTLTRARRELQLTRAAFRLLFELAEENPLAFIDLRGELRPAKNYSSHDEASLLRAVDAHIHNWLTIPEGSAELQRSFEKGLLFEHAAGDVEQMGFLLPTIECRCRALWANTPHVTAPLELRSRFRQGHNLFQITADCFGSSNESQSGGLTIGEIEHLVYQVAAHCMTESAYALSGVLSRHSFDLPPGDSMPPTQRFHMLERKKLRKLSQEPLTPEERSGFLKLLDRYGFLTELAYVEHLKRKLDQAQTIAYFDKGLARDFFARSIPAPGGPTYSVRAFRRWIEPIRNASDELFQGLMMGR